MQTSKRRRSLAEIEQEKRYEKKVETERKKMCTVLYSSVAITTIMTIVCGFFFNPETKLIANSPTLTFLLSSIYFLIVFLPASNAVLSDSTILKDYDWGRITEEELYQKWEKPIDKCMTHMLLFPVAFFFIIDIISNII